MACTITPIVFVSNDGVFFKVNVIDLSVSPFRELVKTVRKMHTNETYTYLLLRTSSAMVSYVFAQGFVQYEVMNMPWNTVLSIMQNIVEVAPSIDDLVKQWEEADKTNDPIDDFFDGLANEDIMTLDLTPELELDFISDIDMDVIV
jgi:hypothetical protein